MAKIAEARILIISANGFEQSELMVPRDELRAAGARVEVASPDGKIIRGWKGEDWGESVEADTALAAVKPQNYDALVIPGGQINPDLLRVNPEALALIKAFADAGKPVAAVCHAPWLLVEAGLAEGKTITGYKSIVTDLKNAGANFVDQEVAIDGNLITSRCPDDLPAFGKAIAEMVSEKAEARSETV